MKLTDEQIALDWDNIYSNDFSRAPFIGGARFARDYYENQIVGLIGSLREQLLSAPYDWGKLESILNRFEDGNGSNP